VVYINEDAAKQRTRIGRHQQVILVLANAFSWNERTLCLFSSLECFQSRIGSIRGQYIQREKTGQGNAHGITAIEGIQLE
jgi:hypothetical protein